MKNRHVFYLVSLIVLSVFLIAVAWEFKLEELIFASFLGTWDTAETFRHSDDLHRWGYIISTTCFVAIALVVPAVLMLKITSERGRAEERNTRLGRIIEQSVNEIYVFDAQSLRFVHVNRGARKNLGYSMDELRDLTPLDLKPELTSDTFEELIRPLRDRTQDQVVFTTVHRRKDGSTYDVEVRLNLSREETPPVFFAIIQDVTGRKRAEEAMRLGAKVFENTNEAILVSDAENRIKSVNPAFTRITGYKAEEVVGKNPSVLSSGRHDNRFYESMWESLSRTDQWAGEIWNRRKNGEVYPEWLSISVIRDEGGNIAEYVAAFSDITKRKRDEERRATYDAVTELPGRTLLFDRLSRAIATAHREKRIVALLFIGLYRFGEGGDTPSPAVGDLALKQAAERLRACAREADTVARLSGNEFSILLPNVSEEKNAAIVAEKVIESLSRKFLLDGHEASIGACIGITVHPRDADDATFMLRNANIAMSRAKEDGLNVFRFFTAEEDA